MKWHGGCVFQCISKGAILLFSSFLTLPAGVCEDPLMLCFFQQNWLGQSFQIPHFRAISAHPPHFTVSLMFVPFPPPSAQVVSVLLLDYCLFTCTFAYFPYNLFISLLLNEYPQNTVEILSLYCNKTLKSYQTQYRLLNVTPSWILPYPPTENSCFCPQCPRHSMVGSWCLHFSLLIHLSRSCSSFSKHFLPASLVHLNPFVITWAEIAVSHYNFYY